MEKRATMTPEEQTLYQNVFIPAFVEKCASRGITFPDDESLDSALETTALVKNFLSSKQANHIKSANLKLKAALGLPIEKEGEDATKSAAFNAAQDPSVRAAIISAFQARTA